MKILGPTPQRNTLMSLGFSASAGIFLRLPSASAAQPRLRMLQSLTGDTQRTCTKTKAEAMEGRGLVWEG